MPLILALREVEAGEAKLAYIASSRSVRSETLFNPTTHTEDYQEELYVSAFEKPR